MLLFRKSQEISSPTKEILIFKQFIMKNDVFLDVTPRVALVTTDVSEELSASIIRVTRIVELGTTVAVTSNRLCISSQRASVASYG
jgi:hypothetical protein